MKRKKKPIPKLIDPYRVFLFKKMIREANERHFEKIRFRMSVSNEYLVFEPCRYTGDRDENAELFVRNLSRIGVDSVIKRNPFGLYSDRPVEEQPVWYVSIPIDQEALPERKRDRNERT